MTEDSPRVKDAYNQMTQFLKQAKEESDLKTQFLLMQKDLENYVKKDKIYHMIKNAIEAQEKAIEKANKNKIQWGPIIQAVIIALIVAGVMRGFQP